MRPEGSAQELERRRRRAMALLEEGYSQAEVARRVGCHPSSVMRWRRAKDRAGPDALKAKPASGRPPKLSSQQKQRLLQYLLEGAMQHGYRTDLWTTKRMAHLIESKFGVTYHRDHVGRLLHSLGWSNQKPKRRALQRDETVIEQWKREQWPRIKKGRRGWAPTSSS
jgi:transposase